MADRDPLLRMSPTRVAAALPLGVMGVVAGVQSLSELLGIGDSWSSDEFERIVSGVSLALGVVLAGFAVILLVAAIMVVLRRPLRSVWVLLGVFAVFMVVWLSYDLGGASRAFAADWLMIAPWVYLAFVAVWRIFAGRPAPPLPTSGERAEE